MSERSLQEEFELGIGAYDLSGGGGKARPAPGTGLDFPDARVIAAHRALKGLDEKPESGVADVALCQEWAEFFGRDTGNSANSANPSSAQMADLSDVSAPQGGNTMRPVSVSDAELEAKWQEFRARYPRKDEAGPTDLTDDDLYTLWKSSTSSDEEFARVCRDLESRGCSTEFSSEEPAVEVSDQELWRHYEDVKSGEAGRRRARRGVEDKFEERLAYWREAAKRGEVLPRDIEGLI